MELEYYSNDSVDVVRKNLNTYINITPAKCNPSPVSDWNRWNLYFKNYAAIDVTDTLQFLIDHGYRLYEDVYDKWKKDPKKCHFVATKQNVITIPGYGDNYAMNHDHEECYCNNFDDYYLVANLKSIRLLALQKLTPKSQMNQILWINDTHRRKRYLIICNYDTVEEWTLKNGLNEYEYRTASIEELLYPKTLQYLQRPLKAHIRTTCKSKNGNCWLCQRVTCTKRKNNMPEFEVVEAKVEASDLL